jgi:DMSO/TMAO reductase YedYZ molybdopterin-dependent catalytic subunit
MGLNAHITTRRALLRGAGALGVVVAAGPGWADDATLNLPGGPNARPLSAAFPQKGRMIVQRVRPALLETPFEVFDGDVFTPNDQFFVRWHNADIPESVDVAGFRLNVRGHVSRPLALSLAEVLKLKRVELAAVNQCSGNSRGLFQPRVPGGQWENGAMGNAKWTGVRLRDVLDRAGVKPGAMCVRFNGLDQPLVDSAPDFIKSLDVDHARDGEVMIAYQMNGAQLPLLNGFPLRLVVPGWYSTYWIKMLNDIEVLDTQDDNYWMKTAYRIPDTPQANVKPGATGFKTVPINRMVPRSFFTNVTSATKLHAKARAPLRGIAFGGDCGVAKVELSTDGGATWQSAKLGHDEGTYSFRRWTADLTAPATGALNVQVRCTNTKGLAQPMEANWNAGGYMRNAVESVRLAVA